YRRVRARSSAGLSVIVVPFVVLTIMRNPAGFAKRLYFGLLFRPLDSFSFTRSAVDRVGRLARRLCNAPPRATCFPGFVFLNRKYQNLAGGMGVQDHPVNIE